MIMEGHNSACSSTTNILTVFIAIFHIYHMFMSPGMKCSGFVKFTYQLCKLDIDLYLTM